MSSELFDPELRALRRDRAARLGVETFLYDRAFEDVGERLALVQRDFSDVLLLGCPNPQWAQWMQMRAGDGRLTVVDPGKQFADLASGQRSEENNLDIEPASQDLVIAIGTLDTANNLPDALLRLRLALRPEGLLIGAIAGGDSLSALRSAMSAADGVSGTASAHVHPRIDPAGLTQLLTNAGLSLPVVDVDRVRVRYSTFERLVGDLRAMGTTNVLNERSRKPFGRAALAAAKEKFSSLAEADGKTAEQFDILHFMGWAPA